MIERESESVIKEKRERENMREKERGRDRKKIVASFKSLCKLQECFYNFFRSVHFPRKKDFFAEINNIAYDQTLIVFILNLNYP